MEHADETGEKKEKSRLGNVLIRKSLVRIFTREVQQDLFKMGNQWCIFYNGPCRVFALKMIVVK